MCIRDSRYTERVAEAGIEPSLGSVGDSYDHALAETINGLYKAAVIHRKSVSYTHLDVYKRQPQTGQTHIVSVFITPVELTQRLDTRVNPVV